MNESRAKQPVNTGEGVTLTALICGMDPEEVWDYVVVVRTRCNNDHYSYTIASAGDLEDEETVAILTLARRMIEEDLGEVSQET